MRYLALRSEGIRRWCNIPTFGLIRVRLGLLGYLD